MGGYLQFIEGTTEVEELATFLGVVLDLIQGQLEEVFDSLNEGLVHEGLHLLVDVVFASMHGLVTTGGLKPTAIRCYVLLLHVCCFLTYTAPNRGKKICQVG